MTSLDLAGLVLVAGRALDLDEATVVAVADLEVAASVLAAAREATGGPERQAATLIHGLVTRQVFGPRSPEVAVLAACQLLALQGLEVTDLGAPAAVRYLLAGVAGGRVGVGELAAWLEQSTTGWREQMFERFTDKARQAVVLAQEEARQLGHPEVATEHLLLGLLAVDGDSAATRTLTALGILPEDLRAELEARIGRGEGAPSGHLTFAPQNKKVFELSLREALQLGHNYIGTEHILLGLVREAESGAAQVLAGRGADLDTVRQEVARQLASGGGDRAGGTKPSKEGLLADIEALFDEIVRLSREVDRLTGLLRRHGIEPEEGTSRSA
ncbi:MAG TPA: Clp protease N-terminal domain-containing protein [Actinomycetes bacterium]|nr:Clp protease N-terminal domain-containing protein [Actinomycetes bacterium]